nr:chromo domain-containing protein LHP1 [Ipomoea trifida]
MQGNSISSALLIKISQRLGRLTLKVQGGSKNSSPIPTKAPSQANQLPMVEGEDWSSEGEFEEEDKVDENGESSNEDEGEQGKGEIEKNGLPDGFYLVEAVRKKRVRQGEPQYLIKWVGYPEKSNTWEPMENLASITDMIDDFEESLAKKKQQKKPLPSPSPVVIKKKNVCCANAGKTKECSKTMESPTNGQPQDQFGTKLIISEPKEELAVPKTNMASEDKSLQRSQEAQSVEGAKKKKRESGPSAKKFKFPKRGECVDLWNLGDDHFADKDLD